VATHGFGSLEREPADKDGEPPEQHLLGSGEEVIAPDDRIS
jgi:hypothetical protein